MKELNNRIYVEIIYAFSNVALNARNYVGSPISYGKNSNKSLPRRSVLFLLSNMIYLNLQNLCCAKNFFAKSVLQSETGYKMVHVVKRFCGLIFISSLFICVYQNVGVYFNRCDNEAIKRDEECSQRLRQVFIYQ